jgi:hypothetical protein
MSCVEIKFIFVKEMVCWENWGGIDKCCGCCKKCYGVIRKPDIVVKEN